MKKIILTFIICTTPIFCATETDAFEAIEIDNTEKVKTLLDEGLSLETRNEETETLLLAASRSGAINCARMLINLNADIHARDNKTSHSPIHHAAFYNHPNIIELLLDNKADIESKCGNWTTALSHAARTDAIESLEVLIKRGANLDACDKFADTSLHDAISSRSKKAIYMLLESGANPNAQNRNGATPLHLAAKSNLFSLSKILLSYWADCQVQDIARKTPSDYADKKLRGLFVESIKRRKHNQFAVKRTRRELANEYNMPEEMLDIICDYIALDPIKENLQKIAKFPEAIIGLIQAYSQATEINRRPQIVLSPKHKIRLVHLKK